MKYGELKKLLRQNKCQLVNQGAKHEMWYSKQTGQYFTVGRHNTQEVAKGTLNSILSTAGITI